MKQIRKILKWFNLNERLKRFDSPITRALQQADLDYINWLDSKELTIVAGVSNIQTNRQYVVIRLELLIGFSNLIDTKE